MTKEQLYKKYAKFYDKVYSKRKYDEEVKFINSIVKNFRVKGKNLLDMACGTGTHAKKFDDKGFQITGVDVNSEMLKIAKKKTKKVSFIKGSMQSFKSKKKFDIITCLFTAINYNKNISELKTTIKNFYNLLNKNGIVIFDLGLIKGKENKKTGAFFDTYSEKNLQIARISHLSQSGDNPDIYNANFLIFIKDKGKVDFEIDEHELGIFSVEGIKSIMEKNGFDVKIYDDFSLKKYTKKSKRPIFVGHK
ncbi:MAG: class I SAM-dependent methyltransferase [Nanoarchaeota archaeon]|nr:class I SAM-dependent methyltransferase [Nanoarchaeota archaeon]